MLRQVSAPSAMVSTVCAASGAAKRSGTSERRRETGSVRMVFRGRSWWRMNCRAERGRIWRCRRESGTRKPPLGSYRRRVARLPGRQRRARVRCGSVVEPLRKEAGGPRLTIKGIPEALLDTLRKQAKENNRSLTQEVINCLRHGVGRPKRDPEVIIRRLKAVRERIRAAGVEPMSTEEIVEMIRRDRDSH